MIAEIAGKRAAQFGRAPVIGDIDVAIALLGYDGTASEAFVTARARARARGESRVPPPACARRRGARCAAAWSPARRRRPTSRRGGRRSRRRSRPRAERKHRRGERFARDRVHPLRRARGAAGVGPAPRRGQDRAERGRAPTRTRSTPGSRGTRGATPASPASRSPRSSAARAAGSSRTRSCVEEVARVCASSSLFTFISKLAMTPVLDHGSDVLEAEVRHAGRERRVPGVVLPLGGRRRQRRRGHAHPRRSATATTTC